MSGNLARRIAVGVAAIPLILFLSHLGGFWNLALIELIVLLCMGEYFRLAGNTVPLLEQSVATILAMFTPIYFYVNGPQSALWPVTLLVIAFGLCQVVRKETAGSLGRAALPLFGVLYVGWTLGHLVLIREIGQEADLPESTGAKLLFLLYIVTWTTDTAAYAFGRLLGRRPFFPSVSPKKTLEGFLAGLAFALIAALVVRQFLLETVSVFQAVVIGLSLGLAGQIGDLVESSFKRAARLKDTSSIIPGHGGALDRFDSLLFNGPLLYYIIEVFIF
jgi:phosphatidate cytidylyltransferase